jgi:hypothetical protein
MLQRGALKRADISRRASKCTEACPLQGHIRTIGVADGDERLAVVTGKEALGTRRRTCLLKDFDSLLVSTRW